MTAAGKLKVGDVIGPGYLPASDFPATVIWVDPYQLNGGDWVFVVWQYPNGGRQGDGYLSDKDIPTLHTSH